VVRVTAPYGRVLGFLNGSTYLFFQVAPHEAASTPFETHYFSENVLAPGIEQGPQDL
jgi:hypothetical protein